MNSRTRLACVALVAGHHSKRKIASANKPSHQQSGSVHSNSLFGRGSALSGDAEKRLKQAFVGGNATYQHLSANKGYVVSFVAGDPWDSWTSAFAFYSRGQGGMADSRRAPRAPVRNESGPVYPCPAARPFLSEIWLGQSRSSSPLFSPRGEAKCVRGASVRGAGRVGLRADVASTPYGEHGEQVRRTNAGPLACLARQALRNPG